MNMSSATGTLSRITLAAPWRRVDLVLPSTVALGELLPEIVRLLDYRTVESPQAYRVSLVDGRVIDFGQSLRSAGVPDGALVRVDRVSEAPMPAVVHDVTDEVADDLERRRGRWGDSARRWLATAVIGVAALWATLLAAPVVPALGLVAFGALVLVIGTGVALAGARAVGTALVLAGTAIVGTSVPYWVGAWPLRWFTWVVLLGLTVLAAGAANRRLRAAAIGAGALFGLLVLWASASALGLAAERTATLLAIVATMTLALLPRYALVASGLTRLDDQQMDDRPVGRVSVRASVDSAHRGLALAAVFTAASAAFSGWILAHTANGWAIALACLLGVSTYLRARAYPLTVEVASLVVATLAVVVGLVDQWVLVAPAQWWSGVLAAVVVLGLGFAALSYRPSVHARARARQLADRIEGVAVVAMVPVAVGLFGVYEDLLTKF